MKIKLREIELGVTDPENCKRFYQCTLGLDLLIDQENLKVFNCGVPGIDFNTSTHFPTGKLAISFLTDNLNAVIEKLRFQEIDFEGPVKSHLGMNTVIFTDPNGYIVKVNAPTQESPAWMKV